LRGGGVRAGEGAWGRPDARRAHEVSNEARTFQGWGFHPCPVVHGSSTFTAAERNKMLAASSDVREYAAASVARAHGKP
jgi:hypothetical protein